MRFFSSVRIVRAAARIKKTRHLSQMAGAIE
jgi:hypothetical protein